MREVGGLRFTPQTPISRNGQLNVIPRFFKQFPQNIYTAHETQKMQNKLF